MTTSWNKALHAALSEQGMMAHKGDVILGFTNGRTSSSRDLTDAEAKALITKISGINAATPRPHDPDPKVKGASKYAADPLDKMRKKVLAHAHLLGWELTSPDPSKGGEKAKVDMKRLQAFLDARGAVKKTLNKMNAAELTDTINQMEKLVASLNPSKGGKTKND
jgi:hypothetical protein